jgi:hypothetical protein
MAHSTCSVNGCEKEAKASRGWCWAHYQRWRKHGDLMVDVPAMSPTYSTVERMDAYSDRSGGWTACWPWTGHRTVDGYGRAKHEGRDHNAQRVAWMLTVGSIPDGMVVCHRCDNPPCVNPDHLFLGSQADNIADMDAKGRRRRAPRPSHCPQGHPYDEANTGEWRGMVRCRACDAERQRAKRARLRDPNFDRSEHGKKAMHVRWHECRGIVKPGCAFCDTNNDGIYSCSEVAAGR